MIIYNVTIKVESAIAAEYVAWLKNEHAPEMLATGCFESFSFSKLLDPVDSEGETYVIQYHTANMELYQKYIDEFSVVMRQKGLDKFGNRFVGFRTLMESVD